MWDERSHQEIQIEAQRLKWDYSNIFIKKQDRTLHVDQRCMNKEHEPDSNRHLSSTQLKLHTRVIQENPSFRDFTQQTSQSFRSLHRISLKLN
jgi:hypothetical protein